MVRVLQYIGSLQFGGSQSFIMEVYRKIDREQIQFDFITFPNQKSGNYEEIIALGGRIYECPQYSAKNHRKFCQWWKHFFEEHREYHILHGHIRSCAAVYLPIAKKYGVKTIIHSHSTSNGSGLSSIIKLIYQYPIRYIADYLFSCSVEAGKWLYGKNVIQKSNYSMIPNCVDLSYFGYSEEVRNQVREEWNIKKEEYVIGHIGRFHESKNHKLIVEIFEELLKKHPNSKLVLVGNGVKEGLQQLNISDEVLDKIVCTGAQARPGKFYQMMDVFLFPSVWEGLPMSVVEAQASGLPCIISDTITKNVVLTDLVVQYSILKTAHEWSEIVLRYIENKRGACSAVNIERLKKFDSAAVANQLQEFYLNIE